jgi:hypothetical protein
LLVYHHPVEDPFHAANSAKTGILDQIEALKPIVLGEYQKCTGGMLVHCGGIRLQVAFPGQTYGATPAKK